MDYTASTTEAIQAGAQAFLSPFFSNLPTILAAVAAIAVTLWGIRWVMSHLKGGKR